MLRYRYALPWLLANRALKRLTHSGIPAFRILLFHDVPANQRTVFEDLLRYVQNEHGLISPPQAAAWIQGHPEHQVTKGDTPPCLITFDDGFVSNFAVAREVLNRVGVKAIFFVCPGIVESPRDTQPDLISANIHGRPLPAQSQSATIQLMSWDEINELAADGHTIGNHGLMHRRLSLLSKYELEKEIHDSADLLEKRTGRQTPWFAYAFGDIDSINETAIQSISRRHAICRSGVRGLNSTTTEPLALCADHIGLDTPFTYQKLVLEGGLDALYRAKRDRLYQMLPR